MKLRRLLCACCLAAVAMPHSVAAQNYTFTNIIDDTGAFSLFGTVGLNNGGDVSFLALLDGGGRGIYRTDGVTTTTIADTTGPYFEFSVPTINDSDQVAFYATRAVDRAILRGDGLTVTKIASVTIDSGLNRPMSMNNSGSVAFYAVEEFDGNFFDAILVGSGGNPTTIADTSGPLAFLNFPSINNVGTVAFAGLLDTGVNGIFRGNGGTMSTVIDSNGPYSYFGSSLLRINDDGVVAATGVRDLGMVGGGLADVLRIDGPTVDVIAGPYEYVAQVGLNNFGDVAFLARFDTGMTSAILTGPDPVADKVIGNGDPLFGSTVDIGPESMDGPNDAGQIVFSYSLADGRHGIALATPIAGLAGDFNHDDVVDAADYVVWRKDMSTGNLLGSGNGNNEFDPEDYDVWRTHFGETLGNGAGANVLPANESVPEPNSLGPFCISVALAWSQRLRRKGSFTE